MSDDDLREVLAEMRAHPDRWTTKVALDALSAVLDLADEPRRLWKPYDTHDIGEAFLADAVFDLMDEMLAAVRKSLGVSDDHS